MIVAWELENKREQAEETKLEFLRVAINQSHYSFFEWVLRSYFADRIGFEFSIVLRRLIAEQVYDTYSSSRSEGKLLIYQTAAVLAKRMQDEQRESPEQQQQRNLNRFQATFRRVSRSRESTQEEIIKVILDYPKETGSSFTWEQVRELLRFYFRNQRFEAFQWLLLHFFPQFRGEITRYFDQVYAQTQAESVAMLGQMDEDDIHIRMARKLNELEALSICLRELTAEKQRVLNRIGVGRRVFTDVIPAKRMLAELSEELKYLPPNTLLPNGGISYHEAAKTFNENGEIVGDFENYLEAKDAKVKDSLKKYQGLQKAAQPLHRESTDCVVS